jgi:hypothetical protein
VASVPFRGYRLLSDGKIEPYRILFHPEPTNIALASADRGFETMIPTIDVSMLYSLSRTPNGLRPMIEEISFIAPKVSGPGLLPGGERVDLSTQLTMVVGDSSEILALEGDILLPFDNGKITTNASETGEATLALQPEHSAKLAFALTTAPIMHLMGSRAGSDLHYYTADVNIGRREQREGMMGAAMQKASEMAKLHADECSSV